MTNKNAWLTGILIAAVLLGAWLLVHRSPADAADADHAATNADRPVVRVVRVSRHDINNSLTIAGEFKPFQEVDVHAKVAGYIRQIYVDVGDHVREGQTLAVLEIPELAAQLNGADAAVRRSREEIRRAKSTVERAQSAHGAAHSAYARLKQASEARAGLVAQQEVDDAQAKDLESEAQVASADAELAAAQQQLEMAQANQQQFNALAGYSKIVAPFAGVITTRYADTGALIQAGTSSSTQSMPVVKLAQTSKLRLILPIPESVAPSIHLGNPVKVRVQALNKDIEGKVSRFADALDQQTRTMQTEIDFENHSGELLPGMYTETMLTLQAKRNVLEIPLTAVSRNGNTATVHVVTPANTLEERHVQLGLDDGMLTEILSGLKEGELVLIGNASQFRPGQTVVPKEEAGEKQESGGQN
ncbi:MAG TPA: efflux RND transporter periplasmic adaptor subunit [Candidatus Dormibacteraeota bacterium]|jgi:RND family efflux transporter MFP subunit|nr:efflux RND transporter periplasmic adaptor subunit [Candidatus Dormibacteraeota bacterium]